MHTPVNQGVHQRMSEGSIISIPVVRSKGSKEKPHLHTARRSKRSMLTVRSQGSKEQPQELAIQWLGAKALRNNHIHTMIMKSKRSRLVVRSQGSKEQPRSKYSMRSKRLNPSGYEPGL